MDEGKFSSVGEGKHGGGDSANDSTSNDSVKVLDSTPKPEHKSKVRLSDVTSPVTPSSSKKRKRLSSEERKEKEKERAEKRAKLEEEKVKREEERQRREQEKKKKDEEKALKAQQREEERLKREEEKKKKLEEEERKRKEREEEKRKKQEEEDRKKREKDEEKRQKELERKKKLEEEEQRKKEREQERLKKLEEKAQKELEVKKKIEEKETEKKKGEEQLAKQAKLLHSFFKSPSTPKTKKRISLSGSSDNDIVCLEDPDDSQPEKPRRRNAFNPMMFEVKQYMALAPRIRRKLSVDEVEALDQLFAEVDDDAMDVGSYDEAVVAYLQYIKSNRRKTGRTELELAIDNDPEVQVIANPILENPKEQGLVKWRYKLLQFHDNKRPAYWGTAKRKPSGVSPRRPWGKDKEVDYDFDSDDEWEEEPEDAEDLAASDKDDEVEEKEEEEDDEDGWLVPHGYLSDDEGAVDEHLDKDTLKEEEKEFYEGLKKQPKIKYPEIQTQRLTDYKIIFCPLRKKWRDQCRAHKSSIPPMVPVGPVA